MLVVKDVSVGKYIFSNNNRLYSVKTTTLGTCFEANMGPGVKPSLHILMYIKLY